MTSRAATSGHAAASARAEGQSRGVADLRPSWTGSPASDERARPTYAVRVVAFHLTRA